MRILYICFNNFNNTRDIGINKKVKSQINSLKKYDKNISYVFLKDNELFIGKEDKEISISNKYKNKIEEKIFRYRDVIHFLSNNNSKFDLVYIRHCGFDMFFQNFIKKLKKISTNIYLEIPTYPYDKEWKSIKPQHILDKIYRNLAKKYIDKIITFSNDKIIFGIDTINIDNGVDVNSVPIKKYSTSLNNTLKLLCVSNLSFWHGYDRVIEGLKEYYKDNQKVNVEFHIVGTGDELKNLKELVKSYELEEYVFFYGSKDGKELDSIFDDCDIAIGSLGIHRIGLNSVSPLKTREYCARAIPFIYSYVDPAFSGEEEFLLNMNNNQEGINILDIINFYNNIDDYKSLQFKMRKYAEINFDWNIQMNKVIKVSNQLSLNK